MTKLVSGLLALLALLPAACGTNGPSADGTGTTAREQPRVEPDLDRLYEGNGAVCDEGKSRPMLWLGGFPLIEGPLPCAGLPLVNWDWQTVEGEEIDDAGTIWGSYHVVGEYDGESFAVTDVGPYEDDPSVSGSTPDTRSPCDEPDGGWVVPDPAHNTQNEVGKAAAYARSQLDYVASWITHLEPERFEFSPVIFNAVFTGAAERHEAEIRMVWEGPLCVVARDAPTARELARIRKAAEASLDDLALEMLWSSGPAVEPVVEIGVVADIGGRGQAALDARFGPGLVRLVPALKPVS
jgi:hypothetical protein